MQEIICPPTEPLTAPAGERLKAFLAASLVTITAIVSFGFLFNRATVLSYSIGYNLYSAERLLAGEVPYRDFYTLYPPASLYLNEALFKCLGVTLYNAMLGVFVFKVLTIVLIYLIGVEVMPRRWAVTAALFSLFWLRPNGAFKAVPMQYGALFLAIAILLLLKNEKRRNTVLVFGAGAALGLLALFKHNIGAYGLVGCLAFIFLSGRTLRSKEGDTVLPQALVAACGFVVVLLPVATYMYAQGALASMTRALLFGPGEFLATRMAFPRSPVVPGLIAVVLSASVFAAHKFRSRRWLSMLIWALLSSVLSAFSLFAHEFTVNKLIFYAPLMVFAVTFFGFVLNSRIEINARREITIVLVFAVAALVELFPRFAREQSIGAMPFVILLLLLLVHVSRASIRKFTGGEVQSKLAIAALTLPFLLIGARLLFGVYFDRSLRFISDTELQSERGRGVYFPKAVASHIDEVVSYIQGRVAPDGYIFAQSNAGSPYLFLAGRKNPSSAQFWGGVGVSSQDRTSTLEEIDRRQVKLIITSDEVLASEKYEALRDYIDQHFTKSVRFDDVVILER